MSPIYRSPLGPLYIELCPDGLRRCSWQPPLSAGEIPQGIEALFPEVSRQLDGYFSGHLRLFKLPLVPRGTEFQRRVWAELLKIPYGSTATYSSIAAAIGSPGGSRAVAQACSRNPIAVIVPCHRVISSGGGLGGYTALREGRNPGLQPRGLDVKRRLLEIESQRP